eukprot:10546687-Alexandrium_andersonii.AAC.1
MGAHRAPLLVLSPILVLQRSISGNGSRPRRTSRSLAVQSSVGSLRADPAERSPERCRHTPVGGL